MTGLQPAVTGAQIPSLVSACYRAQTTLWRYGRVLSRRSSLFDGNCYFFKVETALPYLYEGFVIEYMGDGHDEDGGVGVGVGMFGHQFDEEMEIRVQVEKID